MIFEFRHRIPNVTIRRLDVLGVSEPYAADIRPSQSNIDFSVAKRFSLTESTNLQFRADFFNLLNHANRDNPISDISTGDFGKF